MYFRDGSIILHGDRPHAPFGAEQAHGQHNGQQADGEHHAFRYVSVNGQPYGGFSDGSSYGCTNPNALHPCYRSTLDARRQGDDSQYAGIAQQLQMHVQLGWTDFHHHAWKCLPCARELKTETIGI